MTKPKELYHASSRSDLNIIEPRAESSRNIEEGLVVFATPSLSYATMFLFRWDGSWVQAGFTNSVPIMVISDKERFFEEESKGGSIYVLPSESFSCEEESNMDEFEWISKRSVKPLRSMSFNSALEAMLENGVQVFILDKDTFDKFTALNTTSDRVSFLNSQTSVNKELGHWSKKTMR